MEITLTAEANRETGSRPSGRLRSSGRVPGVVYGLGRENVIVSVAWPDLRRALTTEAGLNALISLEVDGQRDLTIVKDLQRDPVRRQVLHVDFLRVDPDEKVEVEVPLVLTGEAREVEIAKGIVEQQLVTLTVTALPAEIPNELTIDITDLVVGGVITVEDVDLPSGVTTDMDSTTALVIGVASRMSLAESSADGDAGDGDATSAAGNDEGGE